MNREFDHGPSKQVNEVIAIRRPTVGGWEPQHLLADLLELRDLAFQRRMYGPYAVLLASAWEFRLQAKVTVGSTTKDGHHHTYDISLKGRLLSVEGFVLVRLDPSLKGYDAALVQLVESNDRVRAES